MLPFLPQSATRRNDMRHLVSLLAALVIFAAVLVAVVKMTLWLVG